MKKLVVTPTPVDPMHRIKIQVYYNLSKPYLREGKGYEDHHILQLVFEGFVYNAMGNSLIDKEMRIVQLVWEQFNISVPLANPRSMSVGDVVVLTHIGANSTDDVAYAVAEVGWTMIARFLKGDIIA